MTIESLKALGATLNFIDIWIKLVENNYDAIRVAYSTDTKEMFKQIPKKMTKLLSTRQKIQKLMT